MPKGQRAFRSKWVNKINYKADGSIERYKATLVVLINMQIEVVNFTETFAPVAKMVTVRTLSPVASVWTWPVHQMDVHKAFFHGDLQKEVYMCLPLGFCPTHLRQVYRLKKSLYGLQQAQVLVF